MGNMKKLFPWASVPENGTDANREKRENFNQFILFKIFHDIIT